MSEYVVGKFGGSSMAQIELVAEIAKEHPEQRIIVTSAPGKLEGDDQKVTDLLINYAQTRDESLRDDVLDRFRSIFNTLDSDQSTELMNRAKKDLDSPNTAEYIISRGEFFSARALAYMLGAQFIDARDVFYFNAEGFDREASLESIQNVGQLTVKNRLVIPGFYGQDPHYRINLFARGGSDRSGAILAANLGWDYENWTDKDGIFTANPDLVPTARVIDELSREEVREGAHGGAGILQGDTIIDLNGSDTITTVKNTTRSWVPGTRVVPSRVAKPGESVVAFSSRDDLTEITVKDMGMAATPGYVAHLLDRFGDLGLSIQHMPQAQDAFSITTVAQTDQEKAAIEKFETYARDNLQTKTGSVEVTSMGVVYAVGEALRDPKIHNQAQVRMQSEILANGLAWEDVITHRTSPSLAYLVRPQDVEPILQVLHRSEIESK